MPNIEPAIRFVSVSRHFGDVKAVDGVSLDILDGEFFSLLGPSGSGKTTCLRMVAGFERPSAGQIFLHGQDVSNLPPYERDAEEPHRGRADGATRYSPGSERHAASDEIIRATLWPRR